MSNISRTENDYNIYNMSQKPKHIMDLIPEFLKIIKKLEKIKETIVKGSEIEYKSQDARMVALDSLQRLISSVGSGFNVSTLWQIFIQKMDHLMRQDFCDLSEVE